MSMSISDRLQMVIKMNGMTNATFADTIGVQRSSISHVLSGRNKPSIDFIQKILEAFPKVDANWLVAGKKVGKMLIEAESIPVESNIESIVKDEETEAYGSLPKVKVSMEDEVKNPSTLKVIQKIIVFYSDGSFVEVIHDK